MNDWQLDGGGATVDLAAVLMFAAFVMLTLGITWWAAARSHTTRGFYVGSRRFQAWHNGLAIAGDYISAASFLGISGLIYANGYDGLIYAVGFLVGWPIILILVAERLRNLGSYTFADVACFRLRQAPMRSLAACGTLATVTFYLVAQMVGAGQLIQLLFGLPYTTAVIVIGVLMIVTVSYGGMIATTWVQIVKAVLLLSGTLFMAVMVLARFGFDPQALFAEAVRIHPKVHAALMAGLTVPEANAALLGPGALPHDPVSAVSLGLALMFGTAGLPHILMRFFTVADAKQARNSVFYASGFIGLFYLLTVIIGFGAITLVMTDSRFMTPTPVGQTFDAVLQIRGSTNMAAMHLARAIGGDVFYSFICAVALATIMAVVSGLTLAGASAVSHDLYATVIARGLASENDEIRVSKFASLVLGAVAVLLAIAFERLNVAFMVGLAFVIAASANFPVLITSIFWSRLTTRGALIGGWLGLLSAVILLVAGPAVWRDVLGHEQALFPYTNPGLFSISLGFLGIWVGSVTDHSAAAATEKAAYPDQYVRAETGLGAEREPGQTGSAH